MTSQYGSELSDRYVSSTAICTNCNGKPYLMNVLVDDKHNPEPWCMTCIKNRFHDARDTESMYPFWKHDQVQHPSMRHYARIFDDEYIIDYDSKVGEWAVPVESRVTCTCATSTFVGEIDEDADPSNVACNSCGKYWCMHSGDEAGATFGPFSTHSNTLNPQACEIRLSNKDYQRQSQWQGLTQGTDYQICPNCDRHRKSKTNPFRAKCGGCDTLYCFTCGLKRSGQAWVGGSTCSCDRGSHD